MCRSRRRDTMRMARKASARPSGQPADFLKRLHEADGLLLLCGRSTRTSARPGHNARHLLNAAVGGAVHARKHQRRDDRRPAQLRA